MTARRLVRSVSIVACLVCLSGCQQFTTWANQMRYRDPLASSPWNSPKARPLKENQKADVHLAMGRSLEQKGQLSQALAVYRELAKKRNANGIANHRMAIVHDKLGNREDAEKCFQTALKRLPKSAELHCDYGYSRYLADDYPGAEASYRTALELDGELSRAHNNFGLLLARTGRVDLARREFSRAGLENGDVHVNVAYALMFSEDWQGSRQELRRALSVEPESVAARKANSMLDKLAARIPSARDTQQPGAPVVAPQLAQRVSVSSLAAASAMKTQPQTNIAPEPSPADEERVVNATGAWADAARPAEEVLSIAANSRSVDASTAAQEAPVRRLPDKSHLLAVPTSWTTPATEAASVAPEPMDLGESEPKPVEKASGASRVPLSRLESTADQPSKPRVEAPAATSAESNTKLQPQPRAESLAATGKDTPAQSRVKSRFESPYLARSTQRDATSKEPRAVVRAQTRSKARAKVDDESTLDPHVANLPMIQRGTPDAKRPASQPPAPRRRLLAPLASNGNEPDQSEPEALPVAPEPPELDDRWMAADEYGHQARPSSAAD